MRMQAPHRFPYDGIRCMHPVLGWVANQHSKPAGGEAGLMIHSNHEWADAHINEAPETLAPMLKQAASEAFGLTFGDTHYEACHRWLYATPTAECYPKPYIWLDQLNVGICGDWCQAGRVEGAFLSAYQLFDALQ